MSFCSTCPKRAKRTKYLWDRKLRNESLWTGPRKIKKLWKDCKWANLYCIYLFIMDFVLTVCYYHVTYEFQSESTLYSLPECEGTPCSKQASFLKFKWQQSDSNQQPLIALTKLILQRNLNETCCHLNIRKGACFEEGVPWHSGKL